MKNCFIISLFGLLGVLLYSCSDIEQISTDDTVCTININNIQYSLDNNFNEFTTRGTVDNNLVFYFSHKDSVGLFPNDGYQIPFVVPLAEGEFAENVRVKAEGWETQSNKYYAAYYPFEYNNRNGSAIPFSYLNQEVEFDGDLTSVAKYSYRFSTQAQSVNNSFGFSLMDLATIVRVRMVLTDEMKEKAWHTMVLESSVEDLFTIKGSVNLFPEDKTQYGIINSEDVLKSSYISVLLGDFVKNPSNQYLDICVKVPAFSIPVSAVMTCWLYDTEGNVYKCSRSAATSQSDYNRGLAKTLGFSGFEKFSNGSAVQASDLNNTLGQIADGGSPISTVVIGDRNPVVDEVNIPTAITETGSSKLAITFDNPVSASNSTNTITITDGSNGPVQSESLSEINLTFASNTNVASDEIPSLDINLPSSTVTLDRTSGAALFNVVTSKTAQKTLIIKKGVSINTLIVEGGNVIIESGATVGEVINKAPGQSSITDWNDGGSTEGEVNAEISGFQSGN